MMVGIMYRANNTNTIATKPITSTTLIVDSFLLTCWTEFAWTLKFTSEGTVRSWSVLPGLTFLLLEVTSVVLALLCTGLGALLFSEFTSAVTVWSSLMDLLFARLLPVLASLLLPMSTSSCSRLVIVFILASL